MKVISITEPYATIIKNGYKRIETRSWKTKYRGVLYIHASNTKIKKENKENKQLMSLAPTLSYGKIICKCILVDCIEMTKEKIEKLKKENPTEYLCGDYQEGRYAWILDKVEPLNKPIEVKGHLGIWNYEGGNYDNSKLSK